MGKKKASSRKSKKGKGKKNTVTKSSVESSVSTSDLSWKNISSFFNKNKSKKTTYKGFVGENGGLHNQYKKAQFKFCTWLKNVRPEAKLESVNDYNTVSGEILDIACDSIVEFNKDNLPIIVPTEVLEELNTSIELRTKAMINYGGGDEGHKFMLATLKNCRRVLKLSRRIVRVVASKQADTKDDESTSADTIGGRFNALLLEDDVDTALEDDIELDDESILQNKIPKIEPPKEPKGPTKYKIKEDLIEGDDRFQACAFLTTMEELMRLVFEHYKWLKNVMRGQQLHDTSSFLQLLMECTVATNMATECICSMETDLAANHPHLSSFYNVLAVVFLCELTAEIQEKVPSSVISDNPNIVKIFVGDIVDCCFHNRAEKKKESKVGQFAKKAKLPLSTATKYGNYVEQAVRLEIQFAGERQQNERMNALAGGLGIKPHMWFQQSFHVGGEHSILNTHRLTQSIFDVMADGTKLMPNHGFWGPMFDEKTNPAGKIRGDLDELFAGVILPELIELCKHAPMKALPNTEELVTVLDMLAKHIRNRHTTPVPISLTFGLHAMLSSIVVLQGDDDLKRLALSAKQSYNKLFHQLETQSNSEYPRAPSFSVNVNTFKHLVNLAKPVGPPGSVTAEIKAFWNPLVGGEFMLYATYVCSIGLGSATIDSLGQLRLSLHLYNALRKRGLVEDIEFLSLIDKIFQNTKAIWVGGRPEKGSFAKHFWLAWGMSIEQATKQSKMVDSSQDDIIGKDMTRTLDEILPEQYSVSYRRLIQRDFSDAVDDYSVKNVTKKQKEENKHYFELISRINMTRDGMDDDEDCIMPMNLTQAGCLLNEFLCDLCKYMGWESLIHSMVSTCPDNIRKGVRTDGRRPKEDSFETSDTNLERQAMAHFVGNELRLLDHDNCTADNTRKVAKFMKSFFSDVTKEKYTFIVDEVETASNVPSSSIVSPLEGTYPIGHNGKTKRSPLSAFFQYKLSKSGQPVTRLVKPGKKTPFAGYGGEMVNPYLTEPQKQIKLVRQANGKYRHIASYTLEELIDLGWDGAKYVCKKVRGLEGVWVPFVSGYDSDEDDTYDDFDPVDIQAGRVAGLIGLSPDEVGLYMSVPDGSRMGIVVQLRK